MYVKQNFLFLFSLLSGPQVRNNPSKCAIPYAQAMQLNHPPPAISRMFDDYDAVLYMNVIDL